MGDVLAPDNTWKEIDTWKRKCEVIELMYFTLQEEFALMQEKVKHANFLQGEEKICYSYSTFPVRVTEVKVSLKEA